MSDEIESRIRLSDLEINYLGKEIFFHAEVSIETKEEAVDHKAWLSGGRVCEKDIMGEVISYHHVDSVNYDGQISESIEIERSQKGLNPDLWAAFEERVEQEIEMINQEELSLDVIG